MRGLWLENQQLTYRTDLPLPEPAPGQALIRVRMAGICSTDLEMTRGYYPFTGVPGHEFVGEVEEAPSSPEWIGKRVVGEISIVCGECEPCRAGRSSHCEQRSTLGISSWDGVFAEYCVLPVKNLHYIPDSIPDRAAVFTEPLAAGLQILEQVHLHPTDRVLLVGAGRLGLLISRVLQLAGADLTVVARHELQRKILAGYGIRTVGEDEIKADSTDVVVDATGHPGGFTLARKAVRPRGTLVLKSTYAGNLDFNASALVVDEISLVGSRCGPFAPAVRLLEDRLVDPLPLIHDILPLSDGLEGFEKANRPGVLKVLITP